MSVMPLSLTQRSKWVKWWIWTSVLFGWAAWIICMSALSALQNKCSRGQLQYRWDSVGELGPIHKCDKLFGYWWWKICFEWGILVAIVIAMAAARVHVFRVLISTMLAMVTVMLMDMAQGTFFGYYILHKGEEMVRAKCLFAGLIIQCFFNGMLLVGLGTHDEYAEEAEQDYHPGKDHRHDPQNPRPHLSGTPVAPGRTAHPEVEVEIESPSTAAAV